MSVLSSSFLVVCVLGAVVSLLFPSFLPSSPAPPPLLEAAYRGDLHEVRHLLAQFRNRSLRSVDDVRDHWNNTATHWAVKERHDSSLEVVDALIAAGADLSAVNNAGTSALHWSVHSDDEPLIKGLIRRIARQSAPSAPPPPSSSSPSSSPCVHWRNARNETALHWAVDWQKPTAVRVLLAHGSAVGAQDEHGDTPLHRVPIDCDSRTQCRQVVADLIAAGANITAENAAHRTPLQYFHWDAGQVGARKATTEAAPAAAESHGGAVDAEEWAEEMEDRAAEFKRNLTAQFHTV